MAGFLPLLILSVIRKQLNNPVVNFIERQLFLPALLDCESDERNVRVRRLRCVEIAPPLSEESDEIKGLRRVKTPMSEARFLFDFFAILRFGVNKIERKLIQ